MKLSTGIVAILSGVAAAASQPAEVYLLRPTSAPATDADSPSLPRQFARLLFLQGFSQNGRIGSLDDLPKIIRTEDAVSFLNRFGKPPQSLLSETTAEPAQLLVFLEGITTSNTAVLGRAVPGWKPAFTVSDVPSTAANEAFVKNEIGSFDAVKAGCSVESVLSAADDSCAIKGNKVARYDVQKVQ